MTVVLTTAPAVEPISLAEAKAHLRLDASDEDALLTALITAARMFVERTLGVALITQSWPYFLDFWPSAGCITLPILPVQAVGAVRVHDGAGGVITLDAASYEVDALSEPARLVLKGAVPSSGASRSRSVSSRRTCRRPSRRFCFPIAACGCDRVPAERAPSSSGARAARAGER